MFKKILIKVIIGLSKRGLSISQTNFTDLNFDKFNIVLRITFDFILNNVNLDKQLNIDNTQNYTVAIIEKHKISQGTILIKTI